VLRAAEQFRGGHSSSSLQADGSEPLTPDQAVILRMRRDVPDVNAPEVVSHVHNQPVPISADVENNLPRTNEIGSRKVRFYLELFGVPLSSHGPHPLVELRRRISMLLSKCRQPRPRDDVHRIVSNMGTILQSVNPCNLGAI